MTIDGNKIIEVLKAQRNDALDAVALLQAQVSALQDELAAKAAPSDD